MTRAAALVCSRASAVYRTVLFVLGDMYVSGTLPATFYVPTKYVLYLCTT